MKKFLIFILIFLILIPQARAELFVEEENAITPIEEEVSTENVEIVTSNTLFAADITTYFEKAVIIDYVLSGFQITFYATPIGFENITYFYQWEYSLDNKNFNSILYKINNTCTIGINSETINWYIRVSIYYQEENND